MAMSEMPSETTEQGNQRWFQIGLISATALAPLVARWRSLRAAERAAEQARLLREQTDALREQANARLNDAAMWMAQSLPQERLRQARQVSQQVSQAALPAAQQALHQISQVGPGARDRLALLAQQARSPEDEHGRAVRTSLWLTGVAAGLVAAGAIAYVVIRSRALAHEDDDTLVELAVEPVTTDAHPEVSEQAVTETTPPQEPDIALPPVFSDEDAEGAAWVGNIHTRVYHTIDSERLPLPEHRIYFATEEHAIAAGYRRDRAEASRTTQPEQPGEQA